ncbi:hypothetical protein [Oleiphilus messinensis]|uniref:hypothetical protein n=1 Tax=Oleiphilus messinensis TaxID=141451 RepID=UPI0012F7C37F|nr:hypothetical protein [Oleiphilus messinensis]
MTYNLKTKRQRTIASMCLIAAGTMLLAYRGVRPCPEIVLDTHPVDYPVLIEGNLRCTLPNSAPEP